MKYLLNVREQKDIVIPAESKEIKRIVIDIRDDGSADITAVPLAYGDEHVDKLLQVTLEKPEAEKVVIDVLSAIIGDDTRVSVHTKENEE